MSIKVKLVRLIRFIVLILDWVIPKQNNLIIYGGKVYYDNTRYFFEYMVKKHPEFENVWLTRSQKVLENFYIGDCYKIRCSKGLWKFLRAKFAIMSHGYSDFDIFLSNRSRKKKIMLWHGFPIKKIMFASDYKPLKKSQKYDLFTVASRLEQYLMNYCFNLDSRKRIAQITGTPRQDIIFQNLAQITPDSKKKFLSEIGYNGDVKKIILYAPTYREGDGLHFFPFRMDSNILVDYLKKHKVVLILRTHLNNYQESTLFTKNMSLMTNRVILLPQIDYYDVCDFLHLVDVLITDYSSIYFDFLLLNRPIIFLLYDRYEYEKKWGFLLPYEAVMIGKKVLTYNEFMMSLYLAISHPNNDSLARKRMQSLFFEIQDGKACERIYQWIKEN